jgi:nucleotide-binding universal stress UspA family protein
MSLDAQRILIPVNNSSHSENTFRWACHMAKDAKAELIALHVVEVPLEKSLEAEVTEEIERAEQLLIWYEQIARKEQKPRLQARCVRARQVGAAVTQEADIEQVDLVIVGIPFRRNMGRYQLGRIGSYIFQHTSCQVLLWREPMPPGMPGEY